MTTPSITDLIQVGYPPIGQQIILHEVRKSSGKEFWSVGTPMLSYAGRLYLGVEGTSLVVSLSKNSRWIPLPPETLNAQGIEWYGKVSAELARKVAEQKIRWADILASKEAKI